MDHAINNGAKALFLSPDGRIYPDSLICSGIIPAELSGKPCPYAQNGRFPAPVPLDVTHPQYTIDKGNPGELCPPCAKQNWHTWGIAAFAVVQMSVVVVDGSARVA